MRGLQSRLALLAAPHRLTKAWQELLVRKTEREGVARNKSNPGGRALEAFSW